MDTNNLLQEGKKILSGDKSIKDYINALSKDFVALPTEYGFNGFAFDIIQDRNLELKCNFTNEVIDNGSIITQHMTKEPAVITIRGLVFDDITKIQEFEQLSTTIQNKLGVIASYLPTGLTFGAQTKIAQIKGLISGGLSKFDEAIKDGNSMASLVEKINTDNLRTTKIIKNCIKLRDLAIKITLSIFNIEFTNMYISNLQINDKIGTEKGRVEFAITLQQVLEAKQIFSKLNKKEFNGFIKHSIEDKTKKGQSNGLKTDSKTFLQKLIK